MEEKIKIIASTIINYSLDIKEQENILITSETTNPKPLVKELIKCIKDKNANVYVRYIDPETSSLLKECMSEEGVKLLEKINVMDVNTFDAFITIRCNQNDYEEKNVSSNTKKLIGKYLEKSSDIKINKRKWVLLNYPSNVDSYKARMTTDEFFEFSINAMAYDYSKMKSDIKPLKELMEKTDKVRITGKNTDLTFSIKNMPAIPCVGNCNIPDGEIYTAPIKNSVNGKITYNVETSYQGNMYKNVCLEFKDGKIINATCENEQDNKSLNEIFNTDEGARYIGEFSIGFNPLIKYPMGDILFDEKIIGSIHFTPGRAYQDAYNGNTSAIHWDMVLIQRKEFGGGDIYFDDELIRKDGIFVKEELKHLNK